MIGKPPSWSCAPADLRHWLICLVEGLHAQLTQVLKLAQPAPRSPGAAPQYPGLAQPARPAKILAPDLDRLRDLRHRLICLVEGLHTRRTQVPKLLQPAPRSLVLWSDPEELEPADDMRVSYVSHAMPSASQSACPVIAGSELKLAMTCRTPGVCLITADSEEERYTLHVLPSEGLLLQAAPKPAWNSSAVSGLDSFAWSRDYTSNQ